MNNLIGNSWLLLIEYSFLLHPTLSQNITETLLHDPKTWCEEKIIRDIRHSQRHLSPKHLKNFTSLISYMKQILKIVSILSTHLLFSPLLSLWGTTQQSLHLLLLLIENPMQIRLVLSNALFSITANGRDFLDQIRWKLSEFFYPLIRIWGLDYGELRNPAAVADVRPGQDVSIRVGQDVRESSYAVSDGYRQRVFQPLRMTANISFSVSNSVPELEFVDPARKDLRSGAKINDGDKEAFGKENLLFFSGNKCGKIKERDLLSSASSVAMKETKTGNQREERENDINMEKYHMKHQQSVVRYDMEGLEPAFLNEEQYPIGWLVYHPKHGVITREKLLEMEGKKIP